MKKRYILGYDLNSKYSQISFYNFEDEEPKTYEESEEAMQIPLALAFFNDRWVYGKEAKRLDTINQGVAFTNFFEQAKKREKIVANGKTYDAVWLLAKYIRMTLSEYENIEYLTFTVSETDIDMSNLLKGIGQHLGVEKENISVQDYKESFAHYMYNQPKELWQYEAALFYCDIYQMKAYMLRRLNPAKKNENNRFITVDEVASAHINELMAIYPVYDEDQARYADEKFKSFVQGVFDKKVVSSVFLTGEGFENEWYPDSLRVLCNGRRAFLGNNLYSKGACYYSYKMVESPNEGIIYLDDTRLLQRVCLHIKREGKEQWYPIVPWGSHWYEADNQWEVLLDNTRNIEVRVESLASEELYTESISLAGLVERKDYSLRLQINVMFLDEKTCRFTVKDVGFGDFYPATDFQTEKIIHLGGIHGQFNSMSS
ncbi:hypothetical protein M2454_002505 [Aequitasia blattaphilus]|uniref:DUF5716 family protein n=1 Tax=Aequitasia blattaphilus TaxID=2949332 RepID=A0ABT1EC37_9FIRM|nr:DUF5716 family protein [Aequitasia blattaphilus]MCP1103403.1 DUF5716 family protein [Aequitasia blattaphilus]MCR8616043.1 DUF5716 family protein [Aequitasia blattaphilus]